MAKTYEDTSSEFIMKASNAGFLPHFETLGRWWNNNNEIDLVGLNKTQNSILFVETKWNTKPIGTEVLNKLITKSKEVIWGQPNRREYFALIAKGGFTDKLIAQAKKEKVILIEKDQFSPKS